MTQVLWVQMSRLKRKPSIRVRAFSHQLPSYLKVWVNCLVQTADHMRLCYPPESVTMVHSVLVFSKRTFDLAENMEHQVEISLHSRSWSSVTTLLTITVRKIRWVYLKYKLTLGPEFAEQICLIRPLQQGFIS